ncbi:MAG TPA: YceI family protein [Longimicrobium sp.]|nr:YceI family protein [Longimicrobium sp.]
MAAGPFASLLLVPALLIGGATIPAPAVAPAPTAAAAAPVTWQIDVTHSELSFRIRHLVSRVNGTFGEWKGTIVADPASLAGGSVNVEIQTASIDTRNERRDTHLRSADFFDAPNHPTITFRSTRVQAQRGGALKIYGNLTIRGVTKPVVLDGQMLQVAGAPGRRRIGFEATTRINRMDYYVSWNRAAEGGGVTLGDDVDITIAVEATEQAG